MNKTIQYFHFVTGLFHLPKFPQALSMLLHVAEYPSFIKLSNILQYMYTMFAFPLTY